MEALGVAPLALQDGRFTLDILVDRTTTETFANNGIVVSSRVYQAETRELRLETIAEGETTNFVSLKIIPLELIWTGVDASQQ